MWKYPRLFFTFSTFSFLLFFVVPSVMAVPLDVYSLDGPQDPLMVDGPVHELGNQATFPDDEWIDSAFIMWTEEIACFDGGDEPGLSNALVSITNRTNRAWSDLHYVADPETIITNFDGWIGNPVLLDAEEAFKIDNLGINRPLVSESIAANLIFEPGETWEFIIQDYANALGGPANAFDSVNIASLSSGWPPSTGSIVTPEPATLALLALGSIALLRRRK